ncbi:MAG: cation:proton antiporter [Rikenellaceae bacterium]|nr:cation:proton antiporter [Rikenellaceae bacterium]
MEYYHLILFLLAIAIALTAVAPRLMLPYPILLMVAGILLGFIPHLVYIPIDPNIVFLIFLPPLLYDASINISFPDFKAHIKTISMLAVAMVFITIIAIALVARYVIPDISWPVAFVIGAILSPPDAVAASAIMKNVNLPHSTKTILEGESLVNDASALTAYRIALAVVAGGAFVLWEAALEFVIILCGGALIGLILAYLFLKLLEKVKFSSTATVSLNILLPFVACQIAESLELSGVLAVVISGLAISRKMHNDRLFSGVTIVQAKSVWSVIIYVLNGLIFILIGLEFPQALQEIPEHSFVPLILSSFAIFVIALAIRILVIFERKYRLDKIHNLKAKHHKNSGDTSHMMTIDWKNALVIG